jgi:hypothetical protein
MLIEEHRAARAAFQAAIDAVEKIGGCSPAAPAPRVQLGITENMSLQIGGDVIAIPGHPFYATERGKILQHIGNQLMRLTDDAVAERGALLTHRDELLAEWDRQEAGTVHQELAAAEARRDEASNAETEATVVLLTTAPTTLAGATALLGYITEHHEDDYLMTNCGEAGNGYDALVSALIVTLAPLVHK